MKRNIVFRSFFLLACILSLVFSTQSTTLLAETQVEPIKTPVYMPPLQPITEIIFLLDRSGSMSGLENDTIGGFNSFIKSQSELGPTLLTTILFDDRYEVLHNGVNAKNVVLTRKEYYTRGMTALLDAIGKTIVNVNNRFSELNKYDLQRRNVIFVITTDGLENSSKEYTYAKINQMISTQKEVHNWKFIFMGANIDVAKESQRLNIAPDMAFSYAASPKGTEEMYDQVNSIVKGIRSTDEQ